MPAYFGTDADIDHTITGVKVHNWRLPKTAPVFDWTGEGDSQTVTVQGRRMVRLVIEATVTGTTLPDIGDVFTANFDIDGGGVDDIAESWVIQDVEWIVQKQGGGPPQQIRIVASANDSGAGNATATTGVFA